MLAVIQLIMHSVMNTAAHSGSNTAIEHSVMNTAAHCGSNTAIEHSVINTAAHSCTVQQRIMID